VQAGLIFEAFGNYGATSSSGLRQL